MYESFYLRVTAPNEPLGGWIRYTVHKRPGEQPRGSVWFTLFDARAGAPLMHKHTSDAPRVPAGGWIAIGDSGGGQAPTGHDVEGGSISPGQASGRCGPASWSLRWESDEAELRHLGAPFLYRAPLPRTKLTSPAPCARFNGAIELAGRPAITV